jgi:hypothetical protein
VAGPANLLFVELRIILTYERADANHVRNRAELDLVFLKVAERWSRVHANVCFITIAHSLNSSHNSRRS